MTNLGTITPLLFEDRLILSLDKKWIEQFGGIPEFTISIDKNGKLELRSTKSVSYLKST